MDKEKFIEHLGVVEDELRELASECEGAADMLARLLHVDENYAEETITRTIGDVITNLDYAAGFPGENPLREKVDALMEIRNEVAA